MGQAQVDARLLKKSDEVVKSQDEALLRLREVKAELDRLLAEEQKSRNDPLANLKNNLEKVEQLIKDQKELRFQVDWTN